MTFQGPIPKSPKHGRIKEKYRPTPTDRERGFHIWLYENFVCFCGCGQWAEVFHHILCNHPLKRWRRDHEMGVPMTDKCHKALHAVGRESRFRPELQFGDGAADYREMAYREGVL